MKVVIDTNIVVSAVIRDRLPEKNGGGRFWAGVFCWPEIVCYTAKTSYFDKSSTPKMDFFLLYIVNIA